MDSLFAKADAIRPIAKGQHGRPGKHSSSYSSTAAARGSSGGNGKGKNDGKGKGKSKEDSTPSDPTALSVRAHTSIPRSLQPQESSNSTSTPSSSKPKDKFNHIKNPKLRTHLTQSSSRASHIHSLREDASLLTDALGASSGQVECDGPLERTWRLSQEEIVKEVGAEAARGRREWVLDGGPYRSRYTRNGRHLGIVGRNGHVASFDWMAGTMHAELQLKETCRDFTYLHDHTHFAVAQKKHVFIYDQNGVELHRLASHIEPSCLEFLPYHWLLASVGNTGHLVYQDTSTGALLTSLSTRLGPTLSLTQNPHSAVLYLGHTNGTLTLWTPNLSTPAVRLQAHLGGLTSVAVDASSGSAGRYVATAGMDGFVKVWDCRNWGKCVRGWAVRSGGGGGSKEGGGIEVDFSQKGFLAVVSGGSVNVYTPPTTRSPPPNSDPSSQITVPPPLYLTHPLPHRPSTSPRFSPFHDVLTVGHSAGLSSILIPGAGNPHFDSTEADPFEGRKARREREVRGLLDKLSPEMITLDASLTPGALAPPPKQTLPGGEGKVPELPYARMTRIDRLKASGKYDETGENEDPDVEMGEGEGNDGALTKKKGTKQEKLKEKHKMRGKSKSTKRYLRKHRKNVIDPTTVAIRAKLEKQREERRREGDAKRGVVGGSVDAGRKKSALDRFKRAAK